MKHTQIHSETLFQKLNLLNSFFLFEVRNIFNVLITFFTVNDSDLPSLNRHADRRIDSVIMY